MRWHKPWKPADGLTVDEIGSDLMKPYGLRARCWAPSMLEQYARCPYRFALRGVFGLREAERPSAIQRMDPATRGLIYHEVQAELLKGADWLERLDGVLETVAAKYEEQMAPAIPQIWHSEVRSIRADLLGWLQQKLALEAEWSPLACEREFDVELDDGYRLIGRIDLIERRTGGILRVVDHKTGKPPEKRDGFIVGRGEGLQPLLYALAAEKALGERVSFGRLWYATIARNYETLDVTLDEFTRRRALAVLQRIDTAIATGWLPAAPRKDACKACEYLPICGPYEEDRLTHKSQPEWSALRELRGWK
jgi:RecB family exonuclease